MTFRRGTRDLCYSKKRVPALAEIYNLIMVIEQIHATYVTNELLLFDIVFPASQTSLPIIPFTSAEAAVYARIRGVATRAGTTRPVIDLCIAATAITHSLTLVTLNIRGFSAIEGLAVERW